MYLSFNKNNLVSILFFGIFSLLLQLSFPKFFFINGFGIGFDFLLIFLTVLVFSYKNYKIIFLAFILGLIQDYIVSVEQIGIISFIKSFSIFLLGIIKKYQFIWSSSVKYFVVFLVGFFHFLSYYFFIINNLYFFIFYISVIHSFLYFILIFIINRFFFNSKLI